MHASSLLMLILGWILFGAVIGIIARAILPGRQSMSWAATIGLGILGSFLGGALGNFFFGGGRLFVMEPAGWIGSILGALLALALFSMSRGRRLAR